MISLPPEDSVIVQFTEDDPRPDETPLTNIHIITRRDGNTSQKVTDLNYRHLRKLSPDLPGEEPTSEVPVYGSSEKLFAQAAVGKKMCDAIKEHNAKPAEPPIPVIRHIGEVSHELFRTLLSNYEQEQNFYDDLSYLQWLEQWFIQVIEPKPVDPAEEGDWKERELFKRNGYTCYCNPDLSERVKITDMTLMQEVEANLRSVGLR